MTVAILLDRASEIFAKCDLRATLHFLAIDKAAIFLALACALVLSGCNSAPRVVRYRFTVEVEDNGRLVAGSAVQEEHCSFNDNDVTRSLGNENNCGILGEALTVDLDTKGLLFVLLTQDPERQPPDGKPQGLVWQSWMPFTVLSGAIKPPQNSLAKTMDAINALHRPVEMPIAHMPMLVRFRDINDPKSVERVDPSHVDANFGPNVKIVRAMVEITNDPVTLGIQNRAAWIKDLRGSIGKDMHLPYGDLLNQINDGSFRQGMRE